MKAREDFYQAGDIRDGGLLQSEAWEKFQVALGRESKRLGGKNFVGLVIFLQTLFGKRYGYFPRGPLVNPEAENLTELGRELQVIPSGTIWWMRVEPQDTHALMLLRKTFGRRLVRAPHPVQPEETFLINIALEESELLTRMKSKTRYNIRLAEKHGVVIREGNATEDRALFKKLLQETAERKGIRTHPESYYETLLETLPGTARLFFAEYQGKALAANLLLFSGDTVTYLHGGSGAEARKVMAPFLLQWEQIRVARREGYTRYDFGGVRVATRGINARWDGITRFKQGFAPETAPLLFPGTYDIILSVSGYALYRTLRWLRNIFR